MAKKKNQASTNNTSVSAHEKSKVQENKIREKIESQNNALRKILKEINKKNDK